MPQKPYPSLQPERWLVERLENTAQAKPRFEASWYGLYNALLSHYFPYQQQFLVKPQLKIRDEEEADTSFASVQAEISVEIDEPSEEDSFAADLSMTSNGALVFPGSGRSYVPDFIVTKATRFISHDTPLLIIEVKVDGLGTNDKWAAGEHQMDDYMDSLSKQIPANTPLVGLLIGGTSVKIFRSNGPGSDVRMDSTMYNINSRTVAQLLLSIAKNNWDS